MNQFSIQGYRLTLTHFLDEEEAGEQEADGVAPGSLRPDETAVDDGLDGTVEVSGADPDRKSVV